MRESRRCNCDFGNGLMIVPGWRNIAISLTDLAQKLRRQGNFCGSYLLTRMWDDTCP